MGRQIAKQQVRLRAETKQRAWLYPKTTYSELEHNKPYFLFGGGDPRNGLLNLGRGDDSVVHPNGGKLPIDETDILLQPFGTGLDQGWPNIFLNKNVYNTKGIKFLMDRTYQLNGATSGAVVEDADFAVNWGLSGVRTFKFNKYFKNGRRIKYGENADGTDTQVPAVENYGIFIIPYGSGVTTQDEKCGRIEILGNMLFKDL